MAAPVQEQSAVAPTSGEIAVAASQEKVEAALPATEEAAKPVSPVKSPEKS